MPRIVAPIVDRAAISSEFLSASPIPGTGPPNGSVQASKLNSCQMKLKRPIGSLKEKTMITAIGISRYSSARPAYAFRNQSIPRRRERHRSLSVPRSASVPAIRAQMTTMISMNVISRNESAAAVG